MAIVELIVFVVLCIVFPPLGIGVLVLAFLGLCLNVAEINRKKE